MRKFLIKLFLFFAVVFICDRLISMGAGRIMNYAESGEIHKVHSIIKEKSPDLLILGSSRAEYHYSSLLIQDSLDLSTYNAGLTGRGLVFGYGLLKGMEARSYYPKYIVCEITPMFDLMDSVFDLRLNALFPYSDIEGIRELIVSNDNHEKYKLWSHTYRFNSVLPRILMSRIFNYGNSLEGFSPLSGQLRQDRIVNPADSTVSHEFHVSQMRKKYLEKLINEVQERGVQPIFIVSPVYDYDKYLLDEYVDCEISLLKEYDLPVLNHLDDPRFVNHAEYFANHAHLNAKGAEYFSQIIAPELDSIFAIRNDHVK